MKAIISCAAALLTLATVTTADAKGCLKGAVVGGTAGHFAGHHGILGAAAGCVIGRHEANKRARMQDNQNSSRRGEPLAERFRVMGSDAAPPGGWSCGNIRRKFPIASSSEVAVQDGKQVRARTTHELGWMSVALSRLSIAVGGTS